MIFLSHNHADKPVVEPVALRLREIFGQDKVFYDSWSIQPGDGIIDKMNEGLKSPDFVFFFVSAKSLQSGMVRLEWQTGLYKATNGQCKIIPVRVDGTAMPAILMQNVYIDMFATGIEAAIVQIVNVIQGNNTFTPQHAGFSNLSFKAEGDALTEIVIKISASHLMEPSVNFVLLFSNDEADIHVRLTNGQPHVGGFNKDLQLANGMIFNGVAITPFGGAITPTLPLSITVTAKNNKRIALRGVMHKVSETEYASIPLKA
ncbi:toll/interleukin-1 receptor domain-containing protein [Agrobacterium rosae]|uniref:toll/interleukin-1 receptor domain-containing protein n=1 Tax=Agrobacterium rosae TaxID=1972867 RepID=UPI003BA3C1A9